MRTGRWVMAVVVACAAGAAHGGTVKSQVCDVLLPCRNFSGALKDTGPGGFGVYDLRLMINKLSVGTVLVARLIVLADGGREYEDMTWDFWTDADRIDPQGKFVIYRNIPDLGGTNKIGTGRCAERQCTYEYTLDGTKASGRIAVEDGPKLVVSEKTEATDKKVPQETIERQGEVVVDER